MKTQTDINLKARARLVLLAYASFTIGVLVAFVSLEDVRDVALDVALLSIVALLPATFIALDSGKRPAISPGVQLPPRCWNIVITATVGIFCFAWVLLTIAYQVRVSFIVHALLQASVLLAFLLGGSAIRAALRKYQANKPLHPTAGNAPV
jgi:hypothetical protein